MERCPPWSIWGDWSTNCNQLACLESASNQPGSDMLRVAEAEKISNSKTSKVWETCMCHVSRSCIRIHFKVRCDDRCCFFFSLISFGHDLISGQQGSKLIFQVGSIHGVTLQASTELHMVELQNQLCDACLVEYWMLSVFFHVSISCAHASCRTHKFTYSIYVDLSRDPVSARNG